MCGEDEGRGAKLEMFLWVKLNSAIAIDIDENHI
jgi:hypothetical protein